MDKFCCAKCVGDGHLRKVVFAIRGTPRRNCDYCGAADEPSVKPTELRDYFDLILGIYVADDSGRSVVEWLKEDWDLFDGFDVAHAKELLGDIMDNGDVARKPMVPEVSGGSASIHEWETFREELKQHNRYFPRGAPDLDRLKVLVSYLAVELDGPPTVFFRARLQDGRKPFTAGEMGAPPADMTTNGRANPAGIPYLYLASDKRTAISELRPHVGDVVSVAQLNLRKGLRVADLRNPKKTASPFALPDSASVARHRQELPFLARLGEELSRPVRQKAAHIDYLPSQYLCEFIKKCGLDGVMYRSTLAEGVNVALFDPNAGAVVVVDACTITNVRVEF